MKHLKKFDSMWYPSPSSNDMPPRLDKKKKFNNNNGVFGCYDEDGNYFEIREGGNQSNSDMIKFTYDNIVADLKSKGYSMDNTIGVWGSNRSGNYRKD